MTTEGSKTTERERERDKKEEFVVKREGSSPLHDTQKSFQGKQKDPRKN